MDGLRSRAAPPAPRLAAKLIAALALGRVALRQAAPEGSEGSYQSSGSSRRSPWGRQTRWRARPEPEGRSAGRSPAARGALQSVGVLDTLWERYAAALAAWPLPVKAATSAVLAALGDVLAQLTAIAAAQRWSAASEMAPWTCGLGERDQHRWSPRQKGQTEGQSAAAAGGIDTGRLIKFAAVNGLLVGPTFHFWYGWLGTAVAADVPGLEGALLRTAVDQLLFSPLFLLAFLTCVRSLSESPLSWSPPPRKLWWKANCANWFVLPVTQFLNFWLIPLSYQVLFSNVVAIGMSAVMSYLAVAGG